ncbi:MAG: hypothetical protein K2O86_05665 [Clostridia bacterium]|nr:hypothetical protein [Clostridia bacterium]
MRKFRILFVSILLMSILTTSICLCACDNSDKIPTLAYSQVYFQNQNPHITDYFDNESKLTLTAKINSLKELKSFCEEKHLQVYNENDKPYKYDGFSKKIREYDDKFFRKHSIVLVLLFEETTDIYLYDSIDINGKSMTINFISANGDYYAYPHTQIRIFEINKTIARKIKNIDVQMNLGELDQKANIKLYSNGYLHLKNDTDYSIKLTSVEDVTTICDDTTSSIFENSSKYSNNKGIIKKLKEYDEEFFEEKSLIVLFRFRSSSGYFFYVKDFEIIDNSFNITLARDLPKESVMYPCDVITCVYFLEFDKEKIKDVTQINVQEILIQQ